MLGDSYLRLFVPILPLGRFNDENEDVLRNRRLLDDHFRRRGVDGEILVDALRSRARRRRGGGGGGGGRGGLWQTICDK